MQTKYPGQDLVGLGKASWQLGCRGQQPFSVKGQRVNISDCGDPLVFVANNLTLPLFFQVAMDYCE
jgi:hypothetical protein